MKKNILTLGFLALSFSAAAFAEDKAAPAPASNTAAKAGQIPVGSKVKCPVTGEDFTVKENTRQLTHEGKQYAFCCADCQPSFEKSPGKYTKKK